MKRPVKAVVLAAGFGVRLSPLTRSVPKPLLPVMGDPLLLRNLRMLESWGVREALINLHHGAAMVFDAARNWRFDSLRLCFSFEPEILDTGGALSRAGWFPGGDHFWLLNADVVSDIPGARFLGAIRAGDLSAVWLVTGAGPMTVETSRGLVTTFRSRRAGSRGTGTLSGIHLLHPRILRHMPPAGPYSIVTAYESAIAAGERVRAVFCPGALWADIGTPEAYLDACRDIARSAPHGPARFVSLAGDARVSPSARIDDSVVLSKAVVHAGARLRRAIVAPGAHVFGPATGIVVRAADLPPPFPGLTARLGWPLARTMAVPFPARPSDRQFVRLRLGRRSAIALVHHGHRPENDLYVSHARFLSSIGIPVPRVLADAPAERAAVLEDVGDNTLELTAPGMTSAGRIGLYTSVLEAAARLHSSGTKAALAARLRLVDPFSPELYRWEHNLFVDRFLKPRVSLPPSTLRALFRELRGAARVLLGERAVLIHRDFQSSNVHVLRSSIVLIDFQGMRFGAALYDVASLLCDPYVMLPPDEQETLLSVYAALARRNIDEAAGVFSFAGVQRLVQALGAYGRMCENRDTSRFGRYIVPGLTMLDRMVRRAGGMPVLREVVEEVTALENRNT